MPSNQPGPGKPRKEPLRSSVFSFPSFELLSITRFASGDMLSDHSSVILLAS